MKTLKRAASTNKGQTAAVSTLVGAMVAVLVGVNVIDPVFNTTEDITTNSSVNDATTGENFDSQQTSLIDLIGTLFVIGILLLPVKLLL